MSKLKLDKSQFDSINPIGTANRAKKLAGGHGLTTVIPMTVTSGIAARKLLRELMLRENLTEVQPKQMGSSNQFVDTVDIDHTDDPHVIAPIEILHTTMASWQVMDAVSEQQWRNEQIRSKLCSLLVRSQYNIFETGWPRTLTYDAVTNTNIPTIEYIQRLKQYIETNIQDRDKLSEIEALIDQAVNTAGEKYIVDLKIEHIQPFVLEAESIKLNNDGNLVIQWKRSEALLNFRLELCKHGGLAKWGPDVGTTLAYFPNWDTMAPEKRQSICENMNSILNDPIKCEELGISHLTQVVINPTELLEVSFSRNNLAIDSANWDNAEAVFDVDSNINERCLTIKTYAETVHELSHLSQPKIATTASKTTDARATLGQIIPGRGAGPPASRSSDNDGSTPGSSS